MVGAISDCCAKASEYDDDDVGEDEEKEVRDDDDDDNIVCVFRPLSSESSPCPVPSRRKSALLLDIPRRYCSPRCIGIRFV